MRKSLAVIGGIMLNQPPSEPESKVSDARRFSAARTPATLQEIMAPRLWPTTWTAAPPGTTSATTVRTSAAMASVL